MLLRPASHLARSVLPLVAGLAAAALPQRPAASRAKLVALPPLTGYTHTGAYGINNLGITVGHSFSRDTEGKTTTERATCWSGTTPVDLGTLPGDDYSFCAAINRFGTIVGESGTGLGATDREAVIWRNGKIASLGRLPGGGKSSAIWLNNHGVAVGRAWNAEGAGHAALFADGQVTELGTLSGLSSSTATSINNAGVVIGRAWSEDAEHQVTTAKAFLWQNGRIKELPGFSGSTYTVAWDLNDRGLIVGQSRDKNGRDHAVRWDTGRLTDLGIPVGADYTIAWATNQRGQVIGEAGPEEPFRPRPVEWRGKSGSNLGFRLTGNTSGWNWLSPADVNDEGVVTGQGLMGEVERGFKLATR